MNKSLVVLLVVLGLTLVALLVPLPFEGRALRTLGDMAHAPMFALLTVLLYQFVRRHVKWPPVVLAALCWLVISLLGFGCELAQLRVGRYGSWQDVWADSWGALAGIVWVQANDASQWWNRALTRLTSLLVLAVAVFQPTIILIDVIWQWWDAPLVASFERPTELSRWNWQNCRVQPTPGGASDGRSALRVDLLPGKYPGLRMIHPLPDWSRYQRLLIDIQLVDSPPLNLVVKIEDREHNLETEDRFQQVVQLVPGTQRIEIDLPAVANSPRGRQMDMRRISTLSLFTVNLKSARTIYVDRIWLEGS